MMDLDLMRESLSSLCLLSGQLCDKVQCEHIKRDMYWACICTCFKFPGGMFLPKMAESGEI